MSDDMKKCLNAKSDEELVSMIAEEYADKGLSKDELMGAGMDGIAKAHEKYDEKQGRIALIFEKCSFVTSFFRNFATCLTGRKKIYVKRRD